jgi:hypothetical protein
MAAPPRHGMGGSYIALLTAVYVDNGPFLPLWNRLPHWTYWLLPAIIGMPLIWRPLHRYLRSTSDKPSRARPHVVAGHETEKNMATGAVKAARVWRRITTPGSMPYRCRAALQSCDGSRTGRLPVAFPLCNHRKNTGPIRVW